MGDEKQYPIVLASASPRRHLLMREWGYDFTVVVPPIHEPMVPASGTMTAGPWAEALAYFKARSVAMDYPDAIVIGADTIVTHHGEIIGKPRDVDHAREILTGMFAGESDVVTGVAVLVPAEDKRIITHEVTRLVMRAMSEEELEAYLASGAWQDKAGAYSLQEGGDKYLVSMDGSESNVVGLPMEKLGEVLASLGFAKK